MFATQVMVVLLFAALLIECDATRLPPSNMVQFLGKELERVHERVNNSLPLDVGHIIDDGEMIIFRNDLFKRLRKAAKISEPLYVDNLDVEQLRIIGNSDSKSGQSFWVTKDGSMVIKTIKKYECDNLRECIEDIVDHVEKGASCLGNILGLYEIKLYGKKSKYFLVSKNIFNIKRKDYIQEIARFDLKGSTYGRMKSPESRVMKDLDLLQSNTFLTIGQSQKEFLLHVLRRDVKFLSELDFMDYSLLVQQCDQNLPLTVQDSVYRK